MHKRAILYRLGKVYLNDNQDYDGDSKEIHDVKSDGFDWQLVNIVITIVGPINIQTTFNLSGSIGIDHYTTLNRLGLTAGLKPYAYVKANLEGSVSLCSIAKVGVGGELTFLNAELNTGISSGLGWNNTGWLLQNKTQMNLKLDLLSGRLYGFGEIHIPWIGTERYEHDFAKLKGYNYNKTIFDVTTAKKFENWRKQILQANGGF